MSLTVIIASMCEARRADSLRRAIESVRGQLPRDGELVVVANGPEADPALLRSLESQPGTRVVRVAEANVAKAQQVGRSVVATEFFSFLDDDDEYLPGAVETRLAGFATDPAVDVVVTNGFERFGTRDEPWLADPAAAAHDPLRALLRENWLASCAGTFRAARVPLAWFDGQTRYFEWTLLAFRLASRRTVRVLDVPTYRVHATDLSASRTLAYREAEPVVLAMIALLDLPADVRRALRVKIGAAEHRLAVHFLERGDRRRAFSHHLSSLCARGGLRFLPWSRRFVPFGSGSGAR